MVAEQQVVALDVPWLPASGVPAPLLLQDDYTAVLVYRCAPVVGGRRAFVGFPVCLVSKFGYPNDEALASHPLHAQGLGFYGVFEVLNSGWLQEVRDQNLRSFPKKPDWGRDWRHFVITFHDGTFECLADDIVGEFSDKPIEDANALLVSQRRKRKEGSGRSG